MERNFVQEHTQDLVTDDFSKRWAGVLSLLKTQRLHRTQDDKPKLSTKFSCGFVVKDNDTAKENEIYTPEEFNKLATRLTVVFEEFMSWYTDELTATSKLLGISVLLDKKLVETAVCCLTDAYLLHVTSNQTVTPSLYTTQPGTLPVDKLVKNVLFTSVLKPMSDSGQGNKHYTASLFVELETQVNFKIGLPEALQAMEDQKLNETIASQTPNEVKFNKTKELEPIENKGSLQWLKRIWKRLSN